MYLPPLLDDTTPAEIIGYSLVSGYSYDSFKRREDEGLIDCIVDAYVLVLELY